MATEPCMLVVPIPHYSSTGIISVMSLHSHYTQPQKKVYTLLSYGYSKEIVSYLGVFQKAQSMRSFLDNSTFCVENKLCTFFLS